jgi:hypothetical protein
MGVAAGAVDRALTLVAMIELWTVARRMEKGEPCCPAGDSSESMVGWSF